MKLEAVRAEITERLHADGGVPRDHGRDIDKFFSTTAPALGERGLWGLLMPKEYGGSGLTVEEYVVAQQVLGSYDMMAAYSINEHSTIGSLPLVQSGTEEQRATLLPKMASGEMLAAFCLTEPASGSDIRNLATKAVADAGGYRLNGKKIHISLAHHAGMFTVLAEIPSDTGKGLKTAFLVPADEPGVSLGPENSSPPGYLIPVAGSVVLTDYLGSEESILGQIGKGGSIFRHALEIARVGLTAAYIGGADDALARSLHHVQNRSSFGQQLSQHQMIQQKLADMSIDIEAGRLLVQYAAQRIDTDPDNATGASARAKVFGIEAAFRVGTEAVQLHGGRAFLEQPPIDWYMRDAKMGAILGGTSEIMRLLIAKDLLKNA